MNKKSEPAWILWVRYRSWIEASRDLDFWGERVWLSFVLLAQLVLAGLFGFEGVAYGYFSFTDAFHYHDQFSKWYLLLGIGCVLVLALGLAFLCLFIKSLAMAGRRWHWGNHLLYWWDDHPRQWFHRLRVWHHEHRLFDYEPPATKSK